MSARKKHAVFEKASLTQEKQNQFEQLKVALAKLKVSGGSAKDRVAWPVSNRLLLDLEAPR